MTDFITQTDPWLQSTQSYLHNLPQLQITCTIPNHRPNHDHWPIVLGIPNHRPNSDRLRPNPNLLILYPSQAPDNRPIPTIYRDIWVLGPAMQVTALCLRYIYHPLFYPNTMGSNPPCSSLYITSYLTHYDGQMTPLYLQLTCTLLLICTLSLVIHILDSPYAPSNSYLYITTRYTLVLHRRQWQRTHHGW